MSDPQRGPVSDQGTGWGDVASLEMRPRDERLLVKFSCGILVTLWVLVCGLALALLAWRREGSGSSPELIGYLGGSVIGAWLLAYAIGWLVFRLAGRNLVAGRVAASAVVLFSLVGNVGRAGQAAQEHREQAALTRDMRDSIAQVTKGTGSTDPISALDTRATVGGQSGELQVFMKSYINQLIAEHNAYMAELNATGWAKLLDPERLRKDADFSDSRATVRRGKATVEKFRQRWIQTYNEARSAARAMGTGTSMKRGFSEGFLKSSENSYAQAMQTWNLEAQIVSTSGSIVELLSARRGSWTLTSGQFVFSDEQSLSTFNGLVQKLNGLIKREDELRRATLDRTEQALQAMEAPRP